MNNQKQTKVEKVPTFVVVIDDLNQPPLATLKKEYQPIETEEESPETLYSEGKREEEARKNREEEEKKKHEEEERKKRELDERKKRELEERKKARRGRDKEKELEEIEKDRRRIKKEEKG
ncbi:hypothetical protein L6452_15743 [Arctium lappa]|uniref:Uncharacterized protein n=1 Tax=Arctium lappa TaxID=4217 RepID=A0ACB9CPQ4_ARCLA|nr:hypothetical protein L6452_15743 [Arctium lappa]